jgi:hypothetical protein
MSWLDANESFLMEIVARDRLDDLQMAIDIARARATPTDGTSAAMCDRDATAWRPRDLSDRARTSTCTERPWTPWRRMRAACL